MVASSEYQEAVKGKKQDWRYVKPLALADGIPLQITGDNRDAFDEVLGKFGW